MEVSIKYILTIIGIEIVINISMIKHVKLLMHDNLK